MNDKNMKNMTHAELETRIRELIGECDRSSNEKIQLEEELAAALDLNQRLLAQLTRASQRNNLLGRTLRNYLDAEHGE